MPPAIAEQVRTALPTIAQYPENQQKPDPDYVTRKNAFEAVQGEPGAPQDFQEDPEQERRIKAQEQVDSSHSMVPQAAIPALQSFQTHVNDPLARMTAAGTAYIGREAERSTADLLHPGETFGPPSKEKEEQDIQRLRKEHPAAAGISRAVGGTIGGVVADPRMWPLFFMGPEASAAKTAMSAGFATQMAVGAYEQAGELGKIMDNPDVPQDAKWEAGANMVLSTLMAAQTGGHPAIEAVKARLGEFQKLPTQDQEAIRNVLRQKAPEVAAEVDKAAGAQQATPKITWDDEAKTATKPERFRLPRGTSAQEVQGPVKGPNIRTVQVGDKTYAFDQRKINADGVTSAVERNELWRLAGGKAPEAAKVQAEADVRGEEAPAQETKPAEAPAVQWDDEAARTLANTREESRTTTEPQAPTPKPDQASLGNEAAVVPPEPHTTAQDIQPERRTDLATRKRVADLTPDERAHELLTSPKTGLPNDRAFEEDSHALAESHPHVGYADLDDFKRYNDALGHEGVDKAVLPAVGDLFRDAAAKEPGGSVKVYHRSGDEFNFRSTTPEAIKRVTERVNKELADTTFRYETKDGRILEKKGTGLSHGIGTDHESAEENSHADKQRRKELGLREGGRDVSAVDTSGAAGEQTAVRENTERERVPGKPAEEVRPAPRTTAPAEVHLRNEKQYTPGQRISGHEGTEAKLLTPSGGHAVRYRVVESGDLKTSHRSMDFSRNKDYPEGVQERQYHTSKEAQGRVIQQAQNYDPAYTINTNPDAVNGPPVVTPDGLVLGGNSRAMSTGRLYRSGRGNQYKGALLAQADQFGLDKEAIRGMSHPVLVRELAEAPKGIDELRRLGSDLNKSMTGALGVNERAASAGKSVTPETLSHISRMVNEGGEGATLRDVMRQNGREIVRMMVADGVITDRERPQFVDTSTGGLSDEGKTFVERALMGSVVDEPGLMDRAPKAVLAKLEGSLADIASLASRTDEYNILPILRQALEDHAEIAQSGSTVDDHLAQTGMFAPERNPAVDAMVRALAKKPREFRDAMKSFAADANHDVQGQSSLGFGEQPSASAAFNASFGTDFTEDKFTEALLQSLEKGGTIGAEKKDVERAERTPPEAAEGLQRDSRAAEAAGRPAGSKESRPEEPTKEVAKEPAPGSPEYEALRQKLTALEKPQTSEVKAKTGPGIQRVVDRLRTVADGLDKQIEDKQRPMTQNATPKRMREYRSRLHDGENMKRVQQAMRALADAHEQGNVPKGLENLRTKDEIYRLVYKGVEGGGGYYDVIPSQDYANKTPQGKALQELMERHKNEPSEAKAEREKASKISQLEADVQFQKLPGYFPTPKPVVEKMLDAADIQPGDKVLEPSAGKGNIADLIKEREPEAKLSAIEPQSKLRQILELKGHELADSDFLGHKGEYDKIVMNPPFENGQDIDHVQHAFEMLKPGGKLVAIMSESPFFRSDRKGQAFREWLEEHGGTSEKLEPGSFKESGTGVNARMVEIDKPSVRGGDINEIHARGEKLPDITAKSDLSGQTVPAKAPTFFSKAEQVAHEKLPNTVKADQVISTLQNAGVKADEMKWLGLDDYLKGKDKVSKADLLEHIGENNLQVKEVMKGGAKPMLGTGKPFAGDATKFSNYQLPGGENYRELLLTLPEGKTFDQIATEKGYGGWNSRLTDAQKADVEKTYDAQRMKATGFKSGHFDEPNVLAHVRFNDRISPDGKKTLFMEELQSDWHQKGRKFGYKQTPPTESERLEMKDFATRWENHRRGFGAALTPEENERWTELTTRNQNEQRVPDAPFKTTWHELAMKRMLRYAAENGYDQLAWTTGEQQAARYDLSKQLSEVRWNPKDNRLLAYDKNANQVIDTTVPREKLPDYIGKDAAAKLVETPAKSGGAFALEGIDLKVGGSGMKGFYDKILPDFMNKYGKKWEAKVGETELGTDRLTARGAYEGPTDTATLTKLKTLVNSDNWRVSESAKAVLKRIDSGESFDKAMDVGNEGLARELGGKYEFKSEKLPVHSIPITPAMRREVVFGGQPLYAGIDPIAASRAIVQTVKDANGIIKKGSNLYHGAVDKALDWAHMGQTRPEIRKFDPDAADLATKMDAGGQYHKAVAEMIGKKVTGPLTESFDKTDNYASRQKKNEISRDRMKGFHFLADAQNREWLEENHPEDFHRWNADPKIKEALDAYRPLEGQLRDAVKQLGGKTIDEDYIKRIMDFATSGVAYEKGLAQGVEGPVELRQGAAAGARGGGRDNVVSPQIDRSKARKDAGKYYWDHGVFDFGPSFEKRWVEVQSKLDEHRLAVHSMSMGTRIMPDEAMPEKVFYNGQEFYRPDIAKEIREVQKRGVSAESKDLANALGVSELPTPKDVREYASYEPLRRGSRFETAARNLAANVLAGKEGLEGQAANVNRMAKLRYALPKEIVDALNDAGREKELGALPKMISRVLGPLTQFIRQQIVGLGYGVPHMANILRKVVQAQPGAALNPLAWVNGFKVAFSKELKARGISGTEDPTYDMLLRNAAVSEGAIPEYKRYIEGNMDAENWAQTLGNAFRKGGKEGAKVTPLSAAAGVGRLAIEPLNRFSEAGHRNLFKPGGIDQRARLWLGDFLKDRYPGMDEQRIAHEVNQTLGRYNRASWTDLQRNMGPLMLFPGWDYSSMAFALKHPFKTAAAPAVLMLLANAAVHSIGANKNDEKNDLERVHVGKYSIRTNLFNDNMGTHMWGWALRGAKAGLDHKNAKQATGEVVKGIPGDVAGLTTGTMNPIISTPIQVGANRLRPGGGSEIAPRGDFNKKGKILPNKAAEDYADFGARRAFPIYDRATQAGQRPSLASFAGLAGVNVTEKKKKR